MKILCKLGIHKWKKTKHSCFYHYKCELCPRNKMKNINHDWDNLDETHRKCKKCDMEQWRNCIWINEGGEKNFYGYSGWEKEHMEYNSNPFYSGIDL